MMVSRVLLLLGSQRCYSSRTSSGSHRCAKPSSYVVNRDRRSMIGSLRNDIFNLRRRRASHRIDCAPRKTVQKKGKEERDKLQRCSDNVARPSLANHASFGRLATIVGQGRAFFPSIPRGRYRLRGSWTLFASPIILPFSGSGWRLVAKEFPARTNLFVRSARDRKDTGSYRWARYERTSKRPKTKAREGEKERR